MNQDLLVSTMNGTRLCERASWRVPCVTILFHPDPNRVGESARLVDLLHGRTCPLSRVEPLFSRPGEASGRPLATPYVSRKPLRIRPDGNGGVILSAAGDQVVVLEGKPVTDEQAIPREALERGWTLELGDHTVLLVHSSGLPQSPVSGLGMVGESEALERIRRDVLRIADLCVPVLIEGESGSGKELVARAIGAASPRSRAPWVTVNMAAVPATIAASELFGRAAGAYTGAAQAHSGHFQRAHCGTLLLDEIGDTPPEIQSMLLRTLETMEVQPLGSARTQRVDVRVIAATDKDLLAAVRSGRFSEPLYHRLAGYKILLPPLRERRADIGPLFFWFLRSELRSIGEEHRIRELSERDPWLPAALVAHLARHAWPGNVRQLANVVRHLAVLSRGGGRLGIDSLPPHVMAIRGAQPEAVSTATPAARPRVPPSLLEEETLLSALRANRWQVAAAARHLGISRTSLYARMAASERIRGAKDISAEELRRGAQSCRGDAHALAKEFCVSVPAIRRRMRDLDE